MSEKARQKEKKNAKHSFNKITDKNHLIVEWIEGSIYAGGSSIINH